MKVKFKVIPNSSHTQLIGWVNDTYKVKIKEVPEKGKANQALLKLLSHSLKLPKNKINLVSGSTSSLKTIDIQGLNKQELIEKLP